MVELWHTSILLPPCNLIVIQHRAPIPIEATRIGISVTFYELSHRTLGQGAQQGLVQLGSVTVDSHWQWYEWVIYYP